jgi:DNA-binding response OmpR family regulator
MPTRDGEQIRGSVLLLEPNAALRSAISTILCAEQYQVRVVDSLEQVLELASAPERSVALVAWQAMQGLLDDARRPELRDITGRLRLVVMVPRHWWRLLEGTDPGRVVAGLIAKPFQADELLAVLNAALATELSDEASRVARSVAH